MRDYPDFIIANAYVKLAAAQTNHSLGVINDEIAGAMSEACREIIDGKWHENFPIDMIQGETINNMLKNTAQIVHSRHRSVSNFIMNLISALGAYCFFDTKPKAWQGYCIEDTKQLTLFSGQNNLFRFFIYSPCLMAWEENSCICLHMQLIAILSRIGVFL